MENPTVSDASVTWPSRKIWVKKEFHSFLEDVRCFGGSQHINYQVVTNLYGWLFFYVIKIIIFGWINPTHSKLDKCSFPFTTLKTWNLMVIPQENWIIFWFNHLWWPFAHTKNSTLPCPKSTWTFTNSWGFGGSYERYLFGGKGPQVFVSTTDFGDHTRVQTMYFIHFWRVSTILNFIFKPEKQIPSDFEPALFRRGFQTSFNAREAVAKELKMSHQPSWHQSSPNVLHVLFRWSGLNCQFYRTQMSLDPRSSLWQAFHYDWMMLKTLLLGGLFLRNGPTDHPSEKVIFLTFQSVHHFPQREWSKNP